MSKINNTAWSATIAASHSTDGEYVLGEQVAADVAVATAESLADYARECRSETDDADFTIAAGCPANVHNGDRVAFTLFRDGVPVEAFGTFA